MRYSIHLKDKSPLDIDEGSLSGIEALKRLGMKGLERFAAVKVNGELRDLAGPVDPVSELDPVPIDSEEGLEILRHSASHVYR